MDENNSVNKSQNNNEDNNSNNKDKHRIKIYKNLENILDKDKVTVVQSYGKKETIMPMDKIGNMCVHKVKYFIAPNPGIFKLEELNKFLEELFPSDIKPDKYQGFTQNSHEASLFFAKISFIEKIATEKVIRVCRIEQDEIENYSVMGYGKKVEKIEKYYDYTREIKITVYPSREIGQAVIDGEVSKRYIRPKELRKYDTTLGTIKKFLIGSYV